MPAPLPPTTVSQILKWADAHHGRMGRWPAKNSGRIGEAGAGSWDSIDTVLRKGGRGLPGGTTLARLLHEQRGTRSQVHRPSLSVAQVLRWADAHQQRTGQWPLWDSGEVAESPGETWLMVSNALRDGTRGMPEGSSLPRLLAEHRGRRNLHGLPKLTEKQVLRWLDAHQRRTGTWPVVSSGPVVDAPGETWSGVNDGLMRGGRGLPGGSSIAILLAAHRGRRHLRMQPPLTERQMLRWADAHHERTGRWPVAKSGPIAEQPDENWSKIESALVFGRRGLPGGSSLSRLLARHGRKPVRMKVEPLSEQQVVTWALLHHRRTGDWPSKRSGPVADAPDERWSAIHSALYDRRRGLTRQTTLAWLLRDRLGVELRGRSPDRPPLSTDAILEWADDHRRRKGRWPNTNSGWVLAQPTESWEAINMALREGRRGLPGGSSIKLLLRSANRPPDPPRLWRPALTIAQVLEWADDHHRRTGQWPTCNSGIVAGQPGENWRAVNAALTYGMRGLPRGSLAHLLVKERGSYSKAIQPPLTIPLILQWADAHYARTGRWPSQHGRIPGPGRNSWHSVNNALMLGMRGLPGGSSLRELLVTQRGKPDPLNPVKLSIPAILKAADVYHRRTGDWPHRFLREGKIPEIPAYTWSTLDAYMTRGKRGITKRTTLLRLLQRHRMPMILRRGVPLKRTEILDWAAAHHERTGALPTADSGPVFDVNGETWAAIDASLRTGSRGLRGTISLADFLAENYVPSSDRVGARLTEQHIIAWAESFKQRVGYWPTVKSAYTDPSRRETWSTIDTALREGFRGLAGGSSLRKLLAAHRKTTRQQ